MRLAVLEHGHRVPAKAFQRLAALVFRHEVDDVVKTALHPPEFFGRPFFDLLAEVLRGPSFWTPAEREHMAMVTSRLNDYPFCMRVHTETTLVESGGGLEPRPELAAVMALLERVTRTPAEVGPGDVAAVRAAGVPDDAIVDALHVNLVFNTVNRLANAFGWSWDSDDDARTAARVIHLTKYKLPGVVWR